MRIVWLLMLVGCGLPESDFSREYTQGWCDYYLACEDPAILLFDGIDGFEDCEPLVAPHVVTMGSVCKFKGGKAKDCLAAVEALTCPTDEFAFTVPAECSAVYPGCDLSFDLEDEEPTSDEPPAEDSDTDTDQ